MITNRDIKKLKAVFATKEDLKEFATKKDLKQFATKDDLKNFVTKDYLEKVLDERFDQFFKRLEVYLDHRFRPLEEMAADYYKFKDYVTDKLDWLVGKYQKFEDEHMILTSQYSSINERLDTHETEIKTLEKKAVS